MRVLSGDAVICQHALAPRFGKLWQCTPDFRAPFFVYDQWQKIRLREVAIVMRLLFRAHSVSLAFDGVVEACLLRDPSAGFDHPDLAVNFVLQRLANEAEGINLLDFRPRAGFPFAAS